MSDELNNNSMLTTGSSIAYESSQTDARSFSLIANYLDQDVLFGKGYFPDGIESITASTAVKMVLENLGKTYTLTSGYLSEVNHHFASGNVGWLFAINGTKADNGLDLEFIYPGDKLQLFWGDQDTAPY